MRNLEHSKLIYFMAALEPGDLALFRHYVHSPIFNERDELCRLYAYIVSKCLKKPPREIVDTKAIAYLWPDGAGDATKLQKAKTMLMALLISFLEFRHWQSSPAWAGVGLLHELNRMGDESYFEQYYRKVNADLADVALLDMHSLTAQLDLEMALMRHKHTFGTRSADNHLEVACAAMERVVHGHVLKFAFMIANQKQIVGAEMPQWIIEHIAQISIADVQAEPLLEIYYLLFTTHGPTTTLAQLILLKQCLLQHAARCPMHEALDMYTGTLNNFMRFAQIGRHNLVADIFELYQSMVEAVVKKMGSGLNRSHFKNIVYLGSRLGRFEWVDAFLNEGSAWLEGDDHATTLQFNRGVLHFYKKEFVHAERFFNMVMAEIKDVFYALDARSFLLMCFYETGDSMGMESLVHSFRMLLERSDRVSEQHKNTYLAFIRVFRKLIGTPPNDQFRLQQLKAEIELLFLSAGKVWLLEKIGVAGGKP